METYNIHLVATDKPVISSCTLWLMPQKNKLTFSIGGADFRKYEQLSFKAQHLYITSSEEIKEGDYAFYPTLNEVLKVDNNEIYEKGKQLKVAATTNPELWHYPSMEQKSWIEIPKIPQSLIELYVREWNAGKPMKEVKLKTKKVKYELYSGRDSYDSYVEEELELTSDGYVIPLPIEEKMYSREELAKAIYEFGAFLWENEYGENPTKNKKSNFHESYNEEMKQYP